MEIGSKTIAKAQILTQTDKTNIIFVGGESNIIVEDAVQRPSIQIM